MRIIKNLLRFLVTGSFTCIIAACYGGRVMYVNRETEATLKVINESELPIPGLRVNIGADFDAVYRYTDENGELVFFPLIDGDTKLIFDPIIKDVDGEENLGCFNPTAVEIGDLTELTVTLQDNPNRYADEPVTCRFITENGEPIAGLTVSLCDSGCNTDVFITDERGEALFRPLINADGEIEPIMVADNDGIASLGFFGYETEIILGESAVQEFALVMESPPVPTTEESGE